MPTEPDWLDPREDRAWRAFMHAHHQLALRLHRHLLQDSGLTEADYEILAVLSEHPDGPHARAGMCAPLQWEKSRLSHQVRRMQERGLIVREPNPADARSAMIFLLPAGRRAIEDAAPQHVNNVRRHFIDLFTPPTRHPRRAQRTSPASPRRGTPPRQPVPGETAPPH